jgi:hypothetical protein
MKDPLRDCYSFPVSETLLALPKMIFSLEGMADNAWPDMLDKLSQITGDSFGLWPQRPWYDQNGNGAFPFSNEMLSHRDWSNRFNQSKLRQYDGNLIVPSDFSDDRMEDIFSGTSHNIEALINRLPEVVKSMRWILYAINEDALMFLTSAEYSIWVVSLRQWYWEQGGERLYFSNRE